MENTAALKFIYSILLILLGFSACTNNTSDKAIVEGEPILPEAPLIKAVSYETPILRDSQSHFQAYKKLTQSIRSERQRLLNDLNGNQISIDSVGNYFTRIMRDSMYHYWKGTPWEFNGHTDIARKGEIACGYFISTPLKHIGVNVNRYKLAQQAATPIIKSIAKGKDIFRTTSYEKLEAYFNTQPADGLYVIGLSFHVGFILRENGENYMMHSDYYPPVAVCQKPMATCEAIRDSEEYVVGSLSNNPVFLRKWLSGERVSIVQ